VDKYLVYDEWSIDNKISSSKCKCFNVFTYRICKNDKDKEIFMCKVSRGHSAGLSTAAQRAGQDGTAERGQDGTVVGFVPSYPAITASHFMLVTMAFD